MHESSLIHAHKDSHKHRRHTHIHTHTSGPDFLFSESLIVSRSPKRSLVINWWWVSTMPACRRDAISASSCSRFNLLCSSRIFCTPPKHKDMGRKRKKEKKERKKKKEEVVLFSSSLYHCSVLLYIFKTLAMNFNSYSCANKYITTYNNVSLQS